MNKKYVSSYKELIVWQKSIDLVEVVCTRYRIRSRFYTCNRMSQVAETS